MKIKRRENGVFYAYVWTPLGVRPISLKTRNETDARRAAREAGLAKIEAAAKANALTAETVGRIVAGKRQSGAAVFAAWRDWTAVAGLAPNTVSRYDSYITVFLRESGFDSRPLAGATERHVDRFVNPKDSTVVANTRRSRLAAMASFFGFAAAKGLVVGNPAALVRVKLAGLTFEQKEPKKRVPFTEDEMAILRSIEHPFWSTFVLLGEHYGLRLSDVAQLERACIAKPGLIVIWTDKRDRRLELALAPTVRDHLLALESADPDFFFPREATLIADPKRRAQLSVEFGRLLRRLGFRGKSAHCLRHTFATRRATLGDTVDEIREKLGHVSPETTGAYIHERV